MSAKNLECQIASGQIGRYIAGDALSPEAVRQLEAHIAECPDCKKTIDQRRDSLLSMMGGTAATTAAVQISQPEPMSPAESPMAAALRAKIAEKSAPKAQPKKEQPAPTAKRAKPKTEIAKTDTPKTPSLVKPLALSCALAAVLVGMSYASKGSLKFLGPRASDTVVASTPPAETSKAPATTPQTTPVTTPTTAPVEKSATTPANVTPTTTTPPTGTALTPTTSLATTTPTPVPPSTPAASKTIQPVSPPVTQKPATQTPVVEKKTTPVSTPATTKVADQTKPVAVEKKATPPVKTATVAPTKPAPTKTAAPLVKKPVAKVTHRKLRPARKHFRKGTGSIRVYDAAGTPVK